MNLLLFLTNLLCCFLDESVFLSDETLAVSNESVTVSNEPVAVSIPYTEVRNAEV